MSNEYVAIIILNYNSSIGTLNLVASIKKYEEKYYLIIVDNHSSQEQQAILRQAGLDADMIFLDENLGYAAGNNIGLKKAVELQYQYFLIANSDTEIVHPNTIGQLLADMRVLDADAVGPRMLDAGGNPDSGVIIDNRMGRTKRVPADKTTQSRSLTGAFLLLSKKMLLVNGYMPEEYFLYREETDYLARANDRGLRVYYVPSVEIVHRHGLTTGKVWDYYFNRNTIYFARKIRKTNCFELAVFHFLKSVYLTFRIALGLDKRENRWKAVGLMWQGYVDGMKCRMGKKEIV